MCLGHTYTNILQQVDTLNYLKLHLNTCCLASLVPFFTSHLWPVIDSCWAVQRDVQRRDERAGCRGRVPGPQGLASSFSLCYERRGPCRGREMLIGNLHCLWGPRMSKLKVKWCCDMLWEVQVMNHPHTNVFWQGVHKYTHGAPMCLSGTFIWDTRPERHSHSNKHTHTANHSTTDTLNPSLWSNTAVYSKNTKTFRRWFFGK